VWHEVGERIMPGKDPVRFFEMTLKRVSDTTWPAGGAVGPK
jgi:preprotein translocase subunit SecE